MQWYVNAAVLTVFPGHRSSGGGLQGRAELPQSAAARLSRRRFSSPLTHSVVDWAAAVAATWAPAVLAPSTKVHMLAAVHMERGEGGERKEKRKKKRKKERKKKKKKK